MVWKGFFCFWWLFTLARGKRDRTFSNVFRPADQIADEVPLVVSELSGFVLSRQPNDEAMAVLPQHLQQPVLVALAVSDVDELCAWFPQFLDLEDLLAPSVRLTSWLLGQLRTCSLL